MRSSSTTMGRAGSECSAWHWERILPACRYSGSKLRVTASLARHSRRRRNASSCCFCRLRLRDAVYLYGRSLPGQRRLRTDDVLCRSVRSLAETEDGGTRHGPADGIACRFPDYLGSSAFLLMPVSLWCCFPDHLGSSAFLLRSRHAVDTARSQRVCSCIPYFPHQPSSNWSTWSPRTCWLLW